MYSQVETVHSHMLRGLNGGVGRPISINLDADVLDGNVPNRMRSMSELPSKLQGKKKKKLSDMSVRLLLCVCVCGTCEQESLVGQYNNYLE